MNRVLPVLGLFLAVQTQSAFAADCANKVNTVAEGKLTVAAYDYPPFTNASPTGGISGIDAEIVQRIAADNCLEVVPIVTDPAAVIQAIIAGKADVAIGSWNRTEKRSKVMGLSAPLYLDHMAIFSKEGIDTLEGAMGRQVGTVSGFFWVADLQKLFSANLKLYPTPVAMAQDLDAGRIQAAFLGYNTGTFNQRKNGGYKGIQIKIAQPDKRVDASILPPQISVLYTKGNESLGKAIDAGVAKQHADGSMAKSISEAGFDPEIVNVGEPRLIK